MHEVGYSRNSSVGLDRMEENGIAETRICSSLHYYTLSNTRLCFFFVFFVSELSIVLKIAVNTHR